MRLPCSPLAVPPTLSHIVIGGLAREGDRTLPPARAGERIKVGRRLPYSAARKEEMGKMNRRCALALRPPA